MRKHSLLTLVLLVSFSALAQEPFTSKDGGYTVVFPGTPKETESESARTNVVTHLASMSNNSGMYVVTYTDYPNELVQASETMYDTGRDAVARNMMGKVISDKKIELNGVTGREVVSERKSGANVMTAKYRMYMLKNRMYQILYMSTGAVNSKEAIVYFNSFKLTSENTPSASSNVSASMGAKHQ